MGAASSTQHLAAAPWLQAASRSQGNLGTGEPCQRAAFFLAVLISLHFRCRRQQPGAGPDCDNNSSALDTAYKAKLADPTATPAGLAEHSPRDRAPRSDGDPPRWRASSCSSATEVQRTSNRSVKVNEKKLNPKPTSLTQKRGLLPPQSERWIYPLTVPILSDSVCGWLEPSPSRY